ncbi:MAG TPA: Asp-tRNA(Asn)/Glu-tRNA(Gln) amidotransferase subunit GatC [Chloroflexota bacterium]|nr:Asp-tRNA(Asn)/Glu-tRNA(Gln) amidotransferase subunit GatC [Chloroflexota bacterium]
MAISLEDVEHIAHLARLGISDDEKRTFREQLSAILEHMRTLTELDTSGIPPTAQVIPLRNVMRDDEVRPSLPREDVLRNAPDREGEFLRVPPVLD